MKKIILLLFMFAFVSACNHPSKKDEKVIAKTDERPKVVYPWSCFAEEIKADFSKDTIAIIEKYSKMADSIIKDGDIYELMSQTVFPSDAKSLPDSLFVLLQQETFSFDRNLDFDLISGLYPKYISKDEVLFVFAQMSCKSYYWDENKFKNVKCANTKDLKEVLKPYDTARSENIKEIGKLCSQKFKAKFHRSHSIYYSKPIFNKAKTVALMVDNCQWAGDLLIFKKKGGKWRKIATKNLWIS